MHTCPKCNGKGYESYYEDGRLVTDPCYHCSTTGEVDSLTYREDRLASVAVRIATQEEEDCRKAINNDPDSEGYSTHAAECWMSEWDYFSMRVYDRQDSVMGELSKLSIEQQDVLIAWNEYVCEPIVYNEQVVYDESVSLHREEVQDEEYCDTFDGVDDIPF